MKKVAGEQDLAFQQHYFSYKNLTSLPDCRVRAKRRKVGFVSLFEKPQSKNCHHRSKFNERTTVVLVNEMLISLF